jgi:lysozyme family protein
MSKFDDAFNLVLGVEKGYNADKTGGRETMWGITIAVARANGYIGQMIDLPVETAKAIYKKNYWDACKCDSFDVRISFQLFDGAVNSGVKQASKWLQKAIGVREDGKIGQITILAAQDCDVEKVILRFNSYRLGYMTKLKNWLVNSRGWARRIATNLGMGT